MAGELAPEIAERYDLKGRVAVVMVDLGALLDARRRSWEARQVSRYPAVDLDMAFVVDDDVPASDVEATIQDGAAESGRVGCSFRRLARPLYR